MRKILSSNTNKSVSAKPNKETAAKAATLAKVPTLKSRMETVSKKMVDINPYTSKDLKIFY